MNFERVLADLAADPVIGEYLDPKLPPPAPHRGTGTIKLIVLGQDPTVKNPRSRGKISTVLNLNRPGSLRRYLQELCESLGIDLDENVYATNYVNVFFKVPPASIKEPDLLGRAYKTLKPLLDEELKVFTAVPVLSLGQPLLEHLVLPGVSGAVRDYWGYVSKWKSGATGSFRHLTPDENRLEREVFPFPHQPSLTKAFYSNRLSGYVDYMRRTAFAPPA